MSDERSLDDEREALMQAALAQDKVAIAVATFNAVAGLVKPPVLVSTAPVRFDASTNS